MSTTKVTAGPTVRHEAAVLDASAEQALALIKAAGRQSVETLSPAEARRVSNANRALLRPEPRPILVVRDIEAKASDGRAIALRLYRDRPDGVLLPGLVFFHGGGFMLGSIETHDTVCRDLAAQSGAVIVSVEYRLGPEHRFPAGIQDGIEATRWIAENAGDLGIDADRLGVGGDSAGGNLSAVVALHTRDSGGPSLRLQILVYPKTDHSDHETRYARFPEGFRLNRALIEFYESNYLNSDADRRDWRCSPLLAASHRGLPPALVITAGFDPRT
jgi:acetyl esterase